MHNKNTTPNSTPHPTHTLSHVFLLFPSVAEQHLTATIHTLTVTHTIYSHSYVHRGGGREHNNSIYREQSKTDTHTRKQWRREEEEEEKDVERKRQREREVTEKPARENRVVERKNTTHKPPVTLPYFSRENSLDIVVGVPIFCQIWTSLFRFARISCGFQFQISLAEISVGI